MIDDKRRAKFVPTNEVDVVDFAKFLWGLPKPATLVKIDIEGAEWELMDAILAPAVDRFEAMVRGNP